MNPAFIIILLLTVFGLWLLLACAFPFIGKVIADIFKFTVENINEEEDDE